MYDVVILPIIYKSHIYPLFSLANNFIKNGHKVCFVGTIYAMEAVENQGFPFFTIFKCFFPKDPKDNSWSTFDANLLADELCGIISKLKPKIIFVDNFISWKALIIYHRLKTKQVIFHIVLPPLEISDYSFGQYSKSKFIREINSYPIKVRKSFINFFTSYSSGRKKISEISSPLSRMSQVILCPQQFMLNSELKNKKSNIFLGPCLKPLTNSKQNILNPILSKTANKKIIYASFGSITEVFVEKAEFLFNSILKCMKSINLSDYHLILSTGSNRVKWKLIDIPENASVFNWVDQTEILQLASIAIIHGGLGSIKECIYFAVPMLVIPIQWDQFDNAKRVTYHNLGIAMDLDTLNAQEIENQTYTLSKSNQIRDNVIKMRKEFLKAEKKLDDVDLIAFFLH